MGADGLFSTVRRQFLPEVQPKYVGYVAWRGLVDEAELSAEHARRLCDWFGFSLPPGEQMLGYPVAGHGRSGRTRASAGSTSSGTAGRRSRAARWRDLLTDTDGVHHELSHPAQQDPSGA